MPSCVPVSPKKPATGVLVTLRRAAFALVVVVASLYLIALGAVFVFQRGLLYFPDRTAAAPDSAGPAMQVLTLNTTDGEHLVAWYRPPAAGRPVILFFGGNGSTLIGQTDRWRRIADAGVGVLAVAYRGYSGSSGHRTEAGLHSDAEAAYAWLAARYRPADIVIHGHSLGTGVAVRLAVDHPARALILEAPFTSAAEVGQGRYPWLPVKLLMWDPFASRDWIAKVHMPVLIVHGDQDGVIPFAMGRELFGLANQPKTFEAIAGGGHDDLTEMGLYDHIWRFVNPGPALSPPPKSPTMRP